jgi:hypothetical protein
MEGKAATLHRMVNVVLTKAVTEEKLTSFSVDIPYEDLAKDDSGSSEFSEVALRITIETEWVSGDDLYMDEYKIEEDEE